MKIVVLDGYTLNPGDLTWEGFERIGEVAVFDRTSEDEIAERIGDAQAVLTNKTPITAETIKKCPELKYIGVLATGYNVVDIEAAGKAGISVTNIPGYSTKSVAQLTIALLLEICQHVGSHSEGVLKGKWENSLDFAYWDHPLIELDGKTMGIIGFGTIGQEVAKLAQAFGMHVIYNSRTRKENMETNSCKYGTLDEIYENADIISVHCPLFPETEGMINKNSLRKMKKEAILLNTSRGGMIVEADLKEALDRGEIYAAAVDVVSAEPIQKDNPLLHTRNCYITPHIGWATKAARIRCMDIAVNNLKSFVDGNDVNRVN